MTGLQQAKATLDRWYGALRGKDADAGRCRAAIGRGRAVGRSQHAAGHQRDRISSTIRPSCAPARRRSACCSRTPKRGSAGRRPASAGPTDAEIEAAIAARQAARKAKDFKESDRIRDDLKAKGVILEDGPKGTTWKRG